MPLSVAYKVCSSRPALQRLQLGISLEKFTGKDQPHKVCCFRWEAGWPIGEPNGRETPKNGEPVLAASAEKLGGDTAASLSAEAASRRGE